MFVPETKETIKQQACVCVCLYVCTSKISLVEKYFSFGKQDFNGASKEIHATAVFFFI